MNLWFAAATILMSLVFIYTLAWNPLKRKDLGVTFTDGILMSFMAAVFMVLLWLVYMLFIEIMWKGFVSKHPEEADFFIGVLIFTVAAVIVIPICQAIIDKIKDKMAAREKLKTQQEEILAVADKGREVTNYRISAQITDDLIEDLERVENDRFLNSTIDEAAEDLLRRIRESQQAREEVCEQNNQATMAGQRDISEDHHQSIGAALEDIQESGRYIPGRHLTPPALTDKIIGIK